MNGIAASGRKKPYLHIPLIPSSPFIRPFQRCSAPLESGILPLESGAKKMPLRGPSEASETLFIFLSSRQVSISSGFPVRRPFHRGAKAGRRSSYATPSSFASHA